jgi:hypothetical protein
MAMNPLPPQAYTKDTLLHAYSWLQNQSKSIKEMATTPDIMVSLYLKATRDGDSALDRPSIQNFKNELKSLAGMMNELEPPPPPLKPSISATITEQILEVKPSAAPEIQQLDELSLQMLNEIKNGFNLSSQTEALRLVIKLGYLKAQKILTE